MVLVEISNIVRETPASRYFNAEFYALGLLVVGFVPKDPAGALHFVTKWAEGLCFDYVREPNEEVRGWGYALSELSRGKILLGVIPWDTHHVSDIACENRYWVFVDVGSPARHVYVVLKDTERDIYRIFGTGVALREHFDIDVEFYRSPAGFTACWSSEKERLANDENVHTKPYCAIDEEKKRLVNKIVARSRKEKEGTGKRTRATAGTP